MQDLVSIIIRTKNEEQWIAKCLQSVQTQNYSNYEIVVVDTGSTDSTIELVERYPDVKLVHYAGEYYPGKALNYGCRYATGHYFAFLSAHCLPLSTGWLSQLVENIKDPLVAGVYGRQEPTKETSAVDKRDLIITFGLDRIVQWNNPFFHNANSLVKAELWQQVPFDEQVTNIEDRIWAANMLELGYCLVYEPEASVSHYHGIHQTQNEMRLEGVTRILTNLGSYVVSSTTESESSISKTKSHIHTVIPFSEVIEPGISGDNVVELFENLLSDLKPVEAISSIHVLTDSRLLVEDIKSKHLRLCKPFLRDHNEGQTLLKVLQEFIERENLEEDESILLVPFVYVIPSRTEIFQLLCTQYLQSNAKSAVYVRKNYNSLFRKTSNNFHRLDEEIFLYRNLRAPFYEVEDGFGQIISVENINSGCFIGNKPLLVESENKHSWSVRITSDDDCDYVKNYPS